MTLTDPNTAAEQFWSRTRPMENGCIEWVGSKWKAGYGSFALGGVRPAHRFAFLLFHGHAAEGLDLHHKCGNKACVNADHLEPLTRAEHKKLHCLTRSHCPYGHEYTDENTLFRKNGAKRCRECARQYSREHGAAIRARARARAADQFAPEESGNG